ncbi:MAG TPA: helix-turn-helix transcriptional regulator [Clostridia bacterium]|jgi:transcriptional regulator with XRE-family HTH domain|nr:helix-turn-helix transcriptional regulator [Clostridia bacterium]
MSTPEKKPTRSRDFDAEIILGPDATIGDKVKALRLSKKMTLTALSRASGLSDRAIRYIENNERQPSIDAIKKLSAALEVGTDYFMDDDLFQQELHKEDVLAQAKEKYGSRGMAQATRIYEDAQAIYAGGRLNEEERDAFRDMMMEIFFDSKEEAKKYTPKKYRQT